MLLQRRQLLTTGAALAGATALGLSTGARADGRTLFMRSARENADITATLPLYRGTSGGRSVWYIVLDAADSASADRLGVNRSNKLAVARGTAAVQRVRVVNGVIISPPACASTASARWCPGPPASRPRRRCTAPKASSATAR